MKQGKAARFFGLVGLAALAAVLSVTLGPRRALGGTGPAATIALVDGSYPSYELKAIGGLAEAGQAGLASVSLSIESQGRFWSGSGWRSEPTWLACTLRSDTEWLYPVPPRGLFVPGGTYRIQARATDAAGGCQAPAASVTVSVR